MWKSYIKEEKEYSKKILLPLIIEEICDTCIDLHLKSKTDIFCWIPCKINTNSFQRRNTNQMGIFCMPWLDICFLVIVIYTSLGKIEKWMCIVTDSLLSLLEALHYFNFFPMDSFLSIA